MDNKGNALYLRLSVKISLNQLQIPEKLVLQLLGIPAQPAKSSAITSHLHRSL